MNISLQHRIDEFQCSCDALILPFLEDDAPSRRRIASILSGCIKKVSFDGFEGKHGQLLLLPAPEKFRSSWILLAGLGKKDEISKETVRQAGGRSYTSLRGVRVKKTAVSGKTLLSIGISPSYFLEGFLLAQYSYHKYRSDPPNETIKGVSVITEKQTNLRSAIEEVKAVNRAVAFAKDLVNTPSNDMTPAHLANSARSLRQKKLSVKPIYQN